MVDKIKIIFEDKNLVVINKPAGIVCNRAESVKEETLQDWMEQKYKIDKLEFEDVVFEEVFSEFKNRSGLVHRLDKDTSGVMVLAKNAETFYFLKQQFMERKTKKKYMALVHGNVEPEQGTINLPIKRNILNRHKFHVDVDGKMAKTEYKVIEKIKSVDDFSGDNGLYSLVEINLLTGRTHQIRVHFTNLGYPLVCDSLYLGKRLRGDLKFCRRIFLHAKYLSFIHPVSEERVEFEAELSEDLEECLKKLRSGKI